MRKNTLKIKHIRTIRTIINFAVCALAITLCTPASAQFGLGKLKEKVKKEVKTKVNDKVD